MNFNRIPFKWDYNRFKHIFNNKTDGVNNPRERGLEKAIDISINYFFEEYIEENGMNLLVMIILASLYGIEHGQIYIDSTYDVEECIKDIELGKYDDLFTEEALELLCVDIAKVKKHLPA